MENKSKGNAIQKRAMAKKKKKKKKTQKQRTDSGA